jgi:hypothetical protein
MKWLKKPASSHGTNTKISLADQKKAKQEIARKGHKQKRKANSSIDINA